MRGADAGVRLVLVPTCRAVGSSRVYVHVHLHCKYDGVCFV